MDIYPYTQVIWKDGSIFYLMIMGLVFKKETADQFPELFTLLDQVDSTGLMLGTNVTFVYPDLR